MIRDPQAAKRALASMNDAHRLLMDSLTLVKSTCSENEYKEYQAGMAQVLGRLFFLVMEPIYRQHPSLAPPDTPPEFMEVWDKGGLPMLAKAESKAERFRRMHRGGEILLLPNAWDAASARIFEQAEFGAIATTSAGIAFSLGYPDGQRISREEMLGVVERVAAAVKVPVTADVEAGYGNRPEDAAHTARSVIEAGAVGMNLEDATRDQGAPLVELSLQLEKIAAVKEAGRAAGVPLVLNARTDVFLLEVGPVETRYDEAVRRMAAFRDAGADCVFAPGVYDRETIGRLVKDLGCPVNILAGPVCPPVPELQALGVARVSLGSWAMRTTLGLVQRISKELRSSGTYKSLFDAPSFAEVNRLME